MCTFVHDKLSGLAQIVIDQFQLASCEGFGVVSCFNVNWTRMFTRIGHKCLRELDVNVYANYYCPIIRKNHL